MAKKTMDVTVKPGRTVRHREKAEDPEEIYGPGETIKGIPAERGDSLIRAGFAVVAGSEEARHAEAEADRLPDNFPAVQELREAGIVSYSGLATVEDLTEIKGIGEKKAEDIKAAVAKTARD